MKKEPRILIEHILECIELIEEYLRDTAKDKFLNSVQLQDAVIRRIEIIGEAVKNIPTEVKDKYPNIAKRLEGQLESIMDNNRSRS